MKSTYCPQCEKRTVAVMGNGGHITKLPCIRCGTTDPLKTDAAKWANSSLRPPE
jgi:hypothetical protein